MTKIQRNIPEPEQIYWENQQSSEIKLISLKILKFVILIFLMGVTFTAQLSSKMVNLTDKNECPLNTNEISLENAQQYHFLLNNQDNSVSEDGENYENAQKLLDCFCLFRNYEEIYQDKDIQLICQSTLTNYIIYTVIFNINQISNVDLPEEYIKTEYQEDQQLNAVDFNQSQILNMGQKMITLMR
ncbi:hypothetical protein PPERSA_06705 [Pseudocohnilembus persalinus]|uniref:Transmembrane protein n=1 Tax=Pseudocohnilembus persalinus TaxID=266149 RepID=A0A0V0QRY4_PSEPJ|nr:hypothetical protein PPERSA_06705 [Pseudocohnilembus persalinus]|eukprot:KRX05071.1 hypothetical protein PPERSA_06705 [Pseudocohnilembus persalinus]